MPITTANPQVTVESVFEPVLASLTQVVHQLSKGAGEVKSISFLLPLLQSLPLATQEYGLARNRLANAQKYLTAGEGGAAIWELKTLRLRLLNLAESPTKEPRRKVLQAKTAAGI